VFEQMGVLIRFIYFLVLVRGEFSFFVFGGVKKICLDYFAVILETRRPSFVFAMALFGLWKWCCVVEMYGHRGRGAMCKLVKLLQAAFEDSGE